jgi:hypothetical protein
MAASERQVLLDLRPQERFHAAAGELRLQFADGAGGIMEESSESRAHAGLRPRSLKRDAVEDLDLIELVALCFKELPPKAVSKGVPPGISCGPVGRGMPVAQDEQNLPSNTL